MHYFRSMRGLILCLFFCACVTVMYAQDTTAAKTPPLRHSPKKATLLSLALPGAGQIYNKKNWWWKVPIIYGGGGLLVYGAQFYHSNYVDYNNAYLYRINNNVEQNGDIRFDRFQTTTLAAVRTSYRQARDEMIIGLVLLYALQAVDAAVEAHFFEFNINDDLSLNIHPGFIPAGPVAAAGIQLNLKLNTH